MQQLQISEIARAIGCANAPPGAIDRIVTDSRAAEPGALFIAFCGERVDGNDFVPQALQQGAAAAVAERLVSGADASRVMLVPDAKRAMIQIGGLYRDRFELPIVGVTGSVGKTTTKEFIYAVLSKRYCTHKNEGNQNNEL
ncbi:MAG: Mur ligase domain-containing protein, partial [Oscillospiraceae bacterium]